MIQGVRCKRCGRIMPYLDLKGHEIMMTLEDDDGIPYPLSCPQCKYTGSPADWSSNLFAINEGRRVDGTWRSMMAWRRHLQIEIDNSKLRQHHASN